MSTPVAPARVDPQEHAQAESSADRTPGEVFMVDHETVDRHAFESFEASTTEVPGTWYCDELSVRTV